MNLSRRTFAKMGIAGTVAVGAAGLLSLPACSDRPPLRNRSVAAIRAEVASSWFTACMWYGSSWIDVVPYLQAAGLNVAVVQILDHLTDAAAETRRGFRRSNRLGGLGRPFLVGKVLSVRWGSSRRSVLFTSPLGRAERACEDFPALSKRFPTPPASAGVVVSRDGYAELDEATFRAISPAAFQPNEPGALVPFKTQSQHPAR